MNGDLAGDGDEGIRDPEQLEVEGAPATAESAEPRRLSALCT